MAKEEQLLNSKSQDNFTTEKINVITNCLFGNYVGNEYVISDEIKEELLKDKKVKKSVYKNSVFCSAYIVGYGDVVFEATFQKNTVKNVAMAELFVLENEYKINGYIQNTIRTKVAEYSDSIEDFIEKSYRFFNISLTDSDGGKLYDLKEDISMNAYINAKKSFNLNRLLCELIASTSCCLATIEIFGLACRAFIAGTALIRTTSTVTITCHSYFSSTFSAFLSQYSFQFFLRSSLDIASLYSLIILVSSSRIFFVDTT